MDKKTDQGFGEEQSRSNTETESTKSAEVSPFIEAFRMLSHITTALILMLTCGGLGYAIDHYLEVKGVVLIGFLGGGVLGIRHLLAVTSQTP